MHRSRGNGLHDTRNHAGRIEFLQKMNDRIALLHHIEEIDLRHGFTFGNGNSLQAQIDCIVDVLLH